MKQLIFFVLILTHIGCASGQQQGKKIEVEIKGINDSVVYLVHYYGNSNMIADTARRDKTGKYLFTGKQQLPAGVYILVDESKSRPYFEFLIDGQQQFKIRTDTGNIYENLVFTNSPLNTSFREYSKFIQDKRKELESIRKKIQELKDDPAAGSETLLTKLEVEVKNYDREVRRYQEDLVKKDPNSMLALLIRMQWDPEPPYDLKNGTRQDSINAFNYTREHFWDHVDLSDERIVRTPIFAEKLKSYLTVLVIQHPDSVIREGEWIIAQTVSSPELYKFVVWYIVNMAERSNIMGMEKAFVHFAKEYYLAGKTWWASEPVLKKMAERVSVLERILIGVKAPELQMWDTSKQVVSLHRTQAEYTIVVFWDYECGHCSKMLPGLRDYYHEVKDKGVKVFAVCTKSDWDKWTKYIRDKNLDWINVNGSYSVNRYDTLYDIMSTPIIFLLDKEKKILAKKVELEQLKEILQMEMDLARNRDPFRRDD